MKRKGFPLFVTEQCNVPNCMCHGFGVQLSKVHRVSPEEFTAAVEETMARPYAEVDIARAVAERRVFNFSDPLLNFMINWQTQGEA